MADGESRLNILGKVSLPMKIHNTKFTFNLTVTDMKGLDGIWGMDFLNQFKFNLKLSSGTYVFQGQEYPLIFERHRILPHSVRLAKPLKLPPGSETATIALLNRPFRNKQEVMLEPSVHFIQKYGVLPARSVTIQPRRRINTPVQLFNPNDEELVIPEGTVIGYEFPADTLKASNEQSAHVSATSLPSEHPATSTLPPSLVDLEEDIPDHLFHLYTSSCKGLDDQQKRQLALLLIKYSSTFSSSPTDIGLTDLASHEINTGDAQPVRLPLRRQGYRREQEIEKAVQDGLSRGVMEESASPWASAPVVVTKKDGTARFCVDFRKLNSLTKADSYPLPRFDECVDTLHGQKYFCTLDLQSGYWQVPLKSTDDREKTAFLTKKGLFHFTVLPFGLCNAPATFERLMERVLRGLQWERCLLYLDDVLVFGATFEETISNLDKVLARLQSSNLKIKPSKCSLLQPSVEYFGHVISGLGIHPLKSKLESIQAWPSLSSVPRHKLRTEVKRFLGLVSYYRRFIRNMSDISTPLYELTKATSNLIWTPVHEASFQRLKAALLHPPVLAFPDVKAGNFILDTDASNTGIGSVLSQVQNGNETVIGYYSRLLSDAERKYCVTKREFLGVVRAVEHFKPYLYGQQFLLRTDNSAVSHMLTLSDANEQIQRWQLFLSQFKFSTVHRPGRHHINADFMSRLQCDQCGRQEMPEPDRPTGHTRKFHLKESTDVPSCIHTKLTDDSLEDEVDKLMMSCGAVTTRAQAKRLQGVTQPTNPTTTDEPAPVKLPYDDLANLQLSDPDIGPILQLKLADSDYPSYRSISGESLSVKALRQHWRHLSVDNGILYRKLVVLDRPTRHQIVLPRTLRHSVMGQLHCEPTSGHLGMVKSMERVKHRFYWVGWRSDVSRFVSHCEACNVMKRPHRKIPVPLTQQLFGEAFERVSIDLIGPLKETSRGYRYAVTMEDNFTKWVEATPLRTMETEEVCQAVIKEFVSRFGCMYILHSDRGAQFISKIYSGLLEKLGVSRSLTTPYNPKSNGLVENFNKILKSMLKTYVYDHRESTGQWDVMLPIFLMAYRSSVHGSTGETPHFMLTGREMKVPIDLLYTKPSESVTSVPAYVRQLEDRFNKAYALVRNNLKLVQRVQKRQFETNSPKYQALKEGNFVWYYNPRKAFKGDKHLPWKGPYLVKDVQDDFTVTIQLNPEGQLYRTHADKLRLARGVDVDKWMGGG
jgi:transposase InsO family protein